MGVDRVGVGELRQSDWVVVGNAPRNSHLYPYLPYPLVTNISLATNHTHPHIPNLLHTSLYPHHLATITVLSPSTPKPHTTPVYPYSPHFLPSPYPYYLISPIPQSYTDVTSAVSNAPWHEVSPPAILSASWNPVGSLVV